MSWHLERKNWISECPYGREVGQLSAKGMNSTYLSQGKTLEQQLNLRDEKVLALLLLHALTWRNLLGSVKPLTETIDNFCYSGCIDHGVGALAQRLFQVSLLAIMNCNVKPARDMCSYVRSSTPSSEVEHGLLSLAVFKSALSMMFLIFPVSQSPERSESSCKMTPTDSKLELADIPAETLTSRNFISGILKPINRMSTRGSTRVL